MEALLTFGTLGHVLGPPRFIVGMEKEPEEACTLHHFEDGKALVPHPSLAGVVRGLDLHPFFEAGMRLRREEEGGG